MKTKTIKAMSSVMVVLLCALLLIMAPTAIMAGEGDPPPEINADVTGLTDGIDSIATTAKTLVVPLAGLMIIICGIGFMMGQSGRAWAKSMVFSVGLGVALAYSATSLVSMFAAFFN